MANVFSSGRESSLHSELKKWYFLEGDDVEAKVDDFIVDIVRGDLLIEIQIANFSAIKPKLRRLLNDHRVRLVYPIPKVKWIIHRSKTKGEMFGRRKSPKKGRLPDLFNELIRIPNLLTKENLSVEVLMIEAEEVWCNDGKGSWRRRGASVEDRKLIRVFQRKVFEHSSDFLEILPKDLAHPFSNKDLTKSLAIPVNQSRKITYTLRKIGAISLVGKNRNEMLFARGHA
jgi:hypothetical protein